MDLNERYALIVIDVQNGFEAAGWPPRNNPACEANVSRLIAEWRERGRPVVFVKHSSRKPGSPLASGSPGHEFKPAITGEPDLLIEKQVHSAFYGQPDLDGWLRSREMEGVVVTGIATDHCCETTARMAGDLGYRVLFPLDATHTFDRTGPDGNIVAADDVAARTAASLHREFAEVTTTEEVLTASQEAGAGGR